MITSHTHMITHTGSVVQTCARKFLHVASTLLHTHEQLGNAQATVELFACWEVNTAVQYMHYHIHQVKCIACDEFPVLLNMLADLAGQYENFL